jgi:hypothetical protein
MDENVANLITLNHLNDSNKTILNIPGEVLNHLSKSQQSSIIPLLSLMKMLLLTSFFFGPAFH